MVRERVSSDRIQPESHGPDSAAQTRCRALTSRPGAPCQGGGRGFESRRPLQETAGQAPCRPDRAFHVPSACRIPCRSVQSRRDLLVRAIEPSGVMLLDHPRGRVAQPERDYYRVRPAPPTPSSRQCGAAARTGSPRYRRPVAPAPRLGGRNVCRRIGPPLGAVNTSPLGPGGQRRRCSAISNVTNSGMVTARRARR
jgi:hypothetical protein